MKSYFGWNIKSKFDEVRSRENKEDKN